MEAERDRDRRVRRGADGGGDRKGGLAEPYLSDRPFHVGERFTVADIALYAYTHVAGEGGFDLSSYPAIRAWLDLVAAQPGHVPMAA